MRTGNIAQEIAGQPNSCAFLQFSASRSRAGDRVSSKQRKNWQTILMRCLQFKPAADLLHAVEHYWLLEGISQGFERIFPDGHREPAIHPGDRVTGQPGNLWIGQLRQFVDIAPVGSSAADRSRFHVRNGFDHKSIPPRQAVPTIAGPACCPRDSSIPAPDLPLGFRGFASRTERQTASKIVSGARRIGAKNICPHCTISKSIACRAHHRFQLDTHRPRLWLL